MTNNKNYIDPGLRGLSEQARLAFYDNPWNFFVKDMRGEKYEKDFPKHTLVFLTHGTFAVKPSVREALDVTHDSVMNILEKKSVMRLVRNFSDWATKKLISRSGISKDSIIINKASRLIGDPNRSHDAPDYIRKTDFGGNTLLGNPEQFRKDGEDITSEYHLEIETKLKQKEEDVGGTIGFDIHDTGVVIMDKDPSFDTFRENGFPLITLGTKDGEACNQEILDFFSNRLEYYLGIKPVLNEPYKGGFVTTAHGEGYRKKHNTMKRNMIQVEIGRFLYMKESTQEIDWERMEIMGLAFRKAITDTGIQFGEEYFKSIE